MSVLIVAAVLLLAYGNGANDNFKGVATLYGSGTTSRRSALAWATVTTAFGSISAVWFAQQLLVRFSGKGLIPDEFVQQGGFGISVALAAGTTVLLATRYGFPISTTHALLGSMIGAAWLQTEVNWAKFATTLALPLLVSPLVAIAGTLVVYPLLQGIRLRMGVGKESCLCAGREVLEFVPAGGPVAAIMRAEQLSISLGTVVTCRERYSGVLVGIDARQILDSLHFLSAGLVSFARGLNDTPKIAALLLLIPVIGSSGAIFLCGTLIAIGGVTASRQVAESMSHRITTMNAGQGFTANLLTGVLVIWASRWGLPVSTTHVSCGSLFGIGLINRQARWQFILQVLLAWITTLPVAAILGWSFHSLIASVGSAQ